MKKDSLYRIALLWVMVEVLIFVHMFLCMVPYYWMEPSRMGQMPGDVEIVLYVILFFSVPLACALAVLYCGEKGLKANRIAAWAFMVFHVVHFVELPSLDNYVPAQAILLCVTALLGLLLLTESRKAVKGLPGNNVESPADEKKTA